MLERETALGYHSSGRSAAEFAFRFHSAIVGKLAARVSFPFLTHPPAGFTETELLKRRGNLLIADAEKAERLAQVFAEESAAGPGLVRLTIEQAIERARRSSTPTMWSMPSTIRTAGTSRRRICCKALPKARGQTARRFSTRQKCAARDAKSGIWILETSIGEVRARTVVNAAGAWADRTAAIVWNEALSASFHTAAPRSQSTCRPASMSGKLPEICEIDEVFYMKPEAGRLLVSPADATESEPCDAQPEELDIAYAAWYLEQATTIAVSHVAHRWAGLQDFAKDRVPVVGFSGEDGRFLLAWPAKAASASRPHRRSGRLAVGPGDRKFDCRRILTSRD